ncbi:tetratricopeptide repeat protein [Legionella waltersii]|uniref:Tetratricopeptide repeat protein n=1 Tax=Legionella waltersii TaxID=66969 RepID=A0A0W1A5H9_9GAMM|nr:tetratricopeptide repeat protein [Legionella waltersii]KTD76580.1 Tetratricopeptide repeat protein [Legionella waltersii]SNU94452.1 Tetratricopeptide repeat [Legionella waltersii]
MYSSKQFDSKTSAKAIEFTVEKFIQFWNYVQSNTTLLELFKRYLIQKPYDRVVGQKLIFQLGQVQPNLKELHEFLTTLCKDIDKGGVNLKELIKRETKEVASEQAEVTFIERLDNNVSIREETTPPDFSFMYQTRSQLLLSPTERALARAARPDSEISGLTENTLEREETLRIAAAHLALGNQYATDKDDLLAERSYRKAVELYGSEDSHTAFSAKRNLVLTLIKLKRPEDALVFYGEVKARLARLTSDERTDESWMALDSDLQDDLQSIKDIYLDLGHKYGNVEQNYPLAEKSYRKAIELYENDDLYGACSTKWNLGLIFIKAGKLEEALVLYRDIKTHIERITPEEHAQIKWMDLEALLKKGFLFIADAYMDLGSKKRFEEHDYHLAEKNYRKAVELYGNEDSYHAFSAKRGLGRMLVKLGRLDEAAILEKEVETRVQRLSLAESMQPDWAKWVTHYSANYLNEIETIEAQYIVLFKDYLKENPKKSPSNEAAKEITQLIAVLKAKPQHDSKLTLIGLMASKQDELRKANSNTFWEEESEFSQLMSNLFKVLHCDQSFLAQAKVAFECYQHRQSSLTL